MYYYDYDTSDDVSWYDSLPLAEIFREEDYYSYGYDEAEVAWEQYAQS
jgi:hypothetical protein